MRRHALRAIDDAADLIFRELPSATLRQPREIRHPDLETGGDNAIAMTLIAATALETFPNTTLDRARYAALPASPGSVRRAMSYIEEHAGDDIDLTDIADAAHVGPRALQRAFRRAVDTTPLGYLRSVRLGRAHEQLVAADGDDGTTVENEAARRGV